MSRLITLLVMEAAKAFQKIYKTKVIIFNLEFLVLSQFGILLVKFGPFLSFIGIFERFFESSDILYAKNTFP